MILRSVDGEPIRKAGPRSVTLSPLARRLRPSTHACRRWLERCEGLGFASDEAVVERPDLMDKAERAMQRLATRGVMGEVAGPDGYPLTVFATRTRAILCRGFVVLTVVTSTSGFSKGWLRRHGLPTRAG
ncbi:MAG: hypothetical protein H6825_05085 [Planctomycetes bacterium]|nr:hypothetical protein [Planctomycetota bacterium]